MRTIVRALAMALSLGGAAQADADRGAAFRWQSLAAVGDPSEAVAALNRMIAKNPRELKYFEARANIRVSQQDYVRAIQDFDHVIAVAPTAKRLATRASYKAATGELEAAVVDADRALALDPDNSFASGLRQQLLAAIARPEARGQR